MQKCNNKKWIIQTVNSNQEVKPDSQLRALKLLLYFHLDKSWGAKLLSWLKKENWQAWMQEMIGNTIKLKIQVQDNRDKQKHKCNQ